jgi:acyl-CoA synthetase (NDP forming)
VTLASGRRRGERLAGLFQPRSIAIVGATETPGLTRDLLQTLPGRGFEGVVYPVNPRYATIGDLVCYPDVRDLPEAPDLAVILLAPERVPEALTACAERGVPHVVVCSSGFAELGEEGASLQRRVTALVRASGMTLLGPNSIGFINVARSVPAIAIPPASVPARLHQGGAALIAQSAGIMISAMEYGSQVGLGFSLLVSTGNEADVGAIDCLEHVLDDPSTTTVGLVLESVGDGARLIAGVRQARQLGKRVVVLKLGRSRAGAEAVLSHTAGLAGSTEVFDAVCREIGLTQVQTIAELVDTLVLFEKWRSHKAGALAAITISGGTKVLVADLAERYGLPLAELAPATTRRLRSVVPDIGVPTNPLDVTAASIEDAGVFEAAVEALTADPGVAAIALVMHLKKHGGSVAHQRLVRGFVAAQAAADVQLVVISTIPEGVSGFWYDEAASGPVPFLNGIESLRAVAASLAPPPSGAAWAEPEVAADPPAIVQRALESGVPMLTEAETYELLGAAGIPVARFGLAESVEQAIEAANQIGYPVALKIQDPSVAHKLRAGGVSLDLADDGQLTVAYARMRAQWPEGQANVLVQQMVPRGFELLVGAHVDPQFGPIVTLGIGGTLVELTRDVTHRLAPVEPATVADALRGLPGWSAAAGSIDPFIAAPAIDAFSRLAVRLSPWISSIEINPLIVSEDGCSAVDALAELDPAAATA